MRNENEFHVDIISSEKIDHQGIFSTYREAELKGGSLNVSDAETVTICEYGIGESGSWEEINRFTPWEG